MLGDVNKIFYFQMFADNAQQCFAFTPQANFPAHNLNIHWRWRWWDRNHATFLKYFLLYLWKNGVRWALIFLVKNLVWILGLSYSIFYTPYYFHFVFSFSSILSCSFFNSSSEWIFPLSILLKQWIHLNTVDFWSKIMLFRTVC